MADEKTLRDEYKMAILAGSNLLSHQGNDYVSISKELEKFVDVLMAARQENGGSNEASRL